MFRKVSQRPSGTSPHEEGRNREEVIVVPPEVGMHRPAGLYMLAGNFLDLGDQCTLLE